MLKKLLGVCCVLSLSLMLASSLEAKKEVSKKEVKKEKKVDSLAQCAVSSKGKEDPEVWENCCKSHGGKVKGADFNCDEEAKAKAQENEEDFIPPDEEEGGLPPAESEE